ncbi:tRNA lysidine(34) synthetase TilS [Ulvibacter antarcticus]|uniref:tRNA(Ile)-lysidine synthase n=1 Tax=Ulvibacter antarcticus TaxID=442714 RepID=A0A3L9YDQ3_9FLAO|nr:tRNA lysidine(34) synthetase TilS [Ulvibacter antarcticus]RMA58826.1 tRNA(Ile)-lysidine synthase [Ulvibacter antarcticus]
MIKKLEKHISEQLSFLQGKKLLIACSGGLDSVVLSYLLRQLKFEIGLAHCNFSLRGKESDQDEEFVVELADSYSVAVYTETFDTKKFAKEHKLSTQMAARQLRYHWFEEIRQDFTYDYIVTGHHADDDLETFLINLSRGTGLKGLTGIQEINELVVRPILPFTRAEILNFAKEKNLYWREDSSNKKADYLRNVLRLNVLPPFKEAAPGVIASLQKTQKHLKDSYSLIEDYLSLVYTLVVQEIPEGYTINIDKLKELPNTNALLYEITSPFGFTDFKAVSELLESQSGKQVFSETHRLLKDRNVLILTEISEKKEEKEFYIKKNQIKITKPFQMELKSIDKIGNITSSTIYVDNDKIDYPLVVRKWQEGDVFFPFGMKGKKKLSKFFKDEKLSLVRKEKIWVLTSNNQIVWVVGYRPDDRFKVDDKTKNILKVTRTT